MQTLEIYQKFLKVPMGKKLFSKAVCFKAPYFASIHPEVEELGKGRCRIKVKKRRSLENHIGTIHAIAVCNLAEMCAGLCIDATLEKHLRWIPKGMQVFYLAKTTTDLTGVVNIPDGSLKDGDNDILVEVFNTKKELVFKAIINMYVTSRKKQET